MKPDRFIRIVHIVRRDVAINRFYEVNQRSHFRLKSDQSRRFKIRTLRRIWNHSRRLRMRNVPRTESKTL
jgi:hypothetical protein